MFASYLNHDINSNTLKIKGHQTTRDFQKFILVLESQKKFYKKKLEPLSVKIYSNTKIPFRGPAARNRATEFFLKLEFAYGEACKRVENRFIFLKNFKTRYIWPIKSLKRAKRQIKCQIFE